MIDPEKLARAFKNLVEENNALKARLAEVEREAEGRFCELMENLIDRFGAIDAAHQRAVEGINEVLAGHEVALIGLGADPEPVRMVVDATMPADVETPDVPVREETGSLSAPCVVHPPVSDDRPVDGINLARWPDLMDSDMPAGVIRQLALQRQRRS